MTIRAPTADGGCLTGIGVFHPLEGICPDAISSQWSIPEKPVGSATTVQPGLNTNFNPDIAGEYLIRLCCNYETPNTIDPGDLPPVDTDLIMNCPHGAIAGDELFIPLFNCDGTVVWTVNGAITSFQGNTDGVTIQLDPLNPGPVNVSVICTETDANNNQTNTARGCQFPTYDPETLKGPFKSPAVKIQSVLCGTYCECSELRLTVKEDNPDERCQYSEITITIRDCTQPVAEVCE